MARDNIVLERSYAFSLRIIDLYRELSRKREYVISRQVLRSGTSIGANVEEALAGQSRADFLSKMSIASKEARETNYWLRLLRDSHYLTGEKINEILKESEEMINLLTAIVKTTSSRPKVSSSKL